jgi:hypothetical protein
MVVLGYQKDSATAYRLVIRGRFGATVVDINDEAGEFAEMAKELFKFPKEISLQGIVDQQNKLK